MTSVYEMATTAFDYERYQELDSNGLGVTFELVRDKSDLNYM